MGKSRLTKGRKILILVIYLLTTQLFTYSEYASLHIGTASVALCGLFYFFLLANAKDIRRKCHNNQFTSCYFILLFIILPLLTTVSCYIAHGQSIFDSLWVMCFHFSISIYFYLIFIGASKEYILRLLTILMLVKLGLTVAEQFTYPYVPFTARLVNGYTSDGVFREVEVRSGIYRYTIADAYYLYMIVGFYSFSKLIKSKNRGAWLFFLASCIGIYLDQSRQIMVSFILSLFIISFFQPGKNKIRYLLLFGIFIVTIYGYYDFLFEELSEKTSDQMDDENIRFLAYAYYSSNLGDLLTMLFGNGFGGYNSAWGREIAFQELTMGLNRADIGVVGALHLLGAIFVIVFFAYYIFVFLKNWRYIDSYIKMMFISILINIPMLFPLYNLPLGGIDFFMGCLYYLTDKSINENIKSSKLIYKTIAA